LVPKSAVLVWTCPPWSTQYAAAATSDAPAPATTDGDPAEAEPGVVADDPVAEVVAAAEVQGDDAGESVPDPEPQPAKTTASPHAHAARP